VLNHMAEVPLQKESPTKMPRELANTSVCLQQHLKYLQTYIHAYIHTSINIHTHTYYINAYIHTVPTVVKLHLLVNLLRDRATQLCICVCMYVRMAVCMDITRDSAITERRVSVIVVVVLGYIHPLHTYISYIHTYRTYVPVRRTNNKKLRRLE